MRIYIKTPLVNKSKMIPHLVEHWIGHSVLDMEDFFEFSYWLDGVINTDYTYLEYDKWINYEDAVKKITKKITKESFLYEKDIIKQELEDVSYDQRIYECVVRKYLDSDFSMNKYAKASWEDVENYHEKYYQSENMIIVDDEFKILKQWFNIEKNGDNTAQKISKYSLNFEDDKYLVFIWKKTNWAWYWEIYFFFRIMCFYWAYSQRRQKGEYYYLEPYFYEYEDNCIVLIWDYNYSKLDEKFFEWWKNMLLTCLKRDISKKSFS